MKKIPSISKYIVLKDRKKILRNPLPFHHRNFENLGDTFKIDLSSRNKWVFTRNPKSIKHILQTNHKNYGKSTLQTRDLAKYIGHGLLTSNGEFWRSHRRMIQPAFHKKKLEDLLETMYLTIKNELNIIKAEVEDDIFPMMGDLAFQVVAQSLYSTDDIRDRMTKLKDITMRNQTMLIKEMRLPYLKWWFYLKGEIRKHLNFSKKARDILDDLIQHRVDQEREKDDLMDMLLKATYEDGTHMSRKQLIDEVLILFTAGHETTANALSFTIFLLASHPEIQEKAHQEVKMINFDVIDKMELFGKLGYTKQCIEESMRLYPPAYFFDRVSLDDDVVDDHNHRKGTVWLMNIYELHRHPDFWTEPNLFRPDRFDPQSKKNFSDQYFPFGAGPRMCIGNNFVMYEMMLTIAILVQNFKISTSMTNIVLNPLISLKPQEARVRFSTRQ